jgi:hypothetical protein
MVNGAKQEESAEAFDEKECARLSGLSVKWFQARRAKGAAGSSIAGPPFYRIGRACRYPRRDFLAWLDAHLVAPTPEARQAHAARRRA